MAPKKEELIEQNTKDFLHTGQTHRSFKFKMFVEAA